MSGGRLLITLIAVLLLNGSLLGNAYAGFLGFGSDTHGESGLDFSRGYDVNTVGVVTGRVTSLPHQVENEQYLFEVKSASGPVSVSVGPGSYWNRQGIPLHLNDEITAKGSLAQGRDGKEYLLTQKLVNKTTGAVVQLRSESGSPAWSGQMGGGFRSMGGGGFGGGFMRGGGMMGGMRR